LNQNRNQNRRRGRGGNRGQGGGGNPGNRIDSRARGNAPQMLEKYKKLAHDASLNGDRVQTEYYLQFADHYFRVVAEMRSQKDEQRPRHDRDRDQPYDSDDFEADEGHRSEPNGRRDRYEDDRQPEEGQRGAQGDGDETGPEEATAEDNPFTRDTRGGRDRGERQTRGERPGRGRGRNQPANDSIDEPSEDAGFDPGLLPPSISREEEAPRPARGRGRRARPADDADDEALEAAS
jgi:hypothetical protein